MEIADTFSTKLRTEDSTTLREIGELRKTNKILKLLTMTINAAQNID